MELARLRGRMPPADRDAFWVSSLHPGIDLTPTNLAHDLRRALRVS